MEWKNSINPIKQIKEGEAKKKEHSKFKTQNKIAYISPNV